MTDEEVLRSARTFLVRGWCKGSRAQSIDGRAVGPLDPSAVAWCVIGAMDAATGRAHTPRDSDHLLRLLKDASGLDPTRPISYYNDRDDMTQERVLDLYDRALAKMVPSPT